MITIRVADHAPTPGGRFVSDGPFSGEWFREEYLNPALAKAILSGGQVVVELDGTSGYGSSFLEEAFGGLFRSRQFDARDIRDHLAVVARSSLYRLYQQLAERYMREAQQSALHA